MRAGCGKRFQENFVSSLPVITILRSDHPDIMGFYPSSTDFPKLLLACAVRRDDLGNTLCLFEERGYPLLQSSTS